MLQAPRAHGSELNSIITVLTDRSFWGLKYETEMRTLVLGDIHLGCGAGPDVFTGARAFEALLEGAALHPTRIVLNGDTFDFLAHEADRGADDQQLMHAFAEDARVSVFLAALGRTLARGCLLVIRAGEHDRALERPDIQAILVRAITSADACATRITFNSRSHPTLLEIGGVRVIVTHDVHQRDGASAHWIVAHLFNLLRRQYGVGLADLLRPDYATAMIAALAVNPTAAKHVFRLADEDGPPGAGVASSTALQLPRVFARSGLTPRERRVLSDALDPAVVLGVSPEDSPVLERARLKVFRHVLTHHAAPASEEPRRIVGAEWNAARSLARRFGASVAVLGHSRAIGWRSEDLLTAVDVGSWTRLLDLPQVGCGDAVWLRTLEAWQRTVKICGAPDDVPLRSLRTAALLEPMPARGGARLALVEWRPDSGLVRLRERSLPPQAI